MSNEYETIKKEIADNIATYLENHWSELKGCWLDNDKSPELRTMLKKSNTKLI